MRLFIIRHGDPDYAHDSLTEKGLREAEALAEWFADVRLDEIFASPLGRAQMTAAPTAAQNGMEVKILPFTAESMDYMASFSAQDDIGYTYSVKGGVSDYRDGSGRFEERSATLAEMIKGSDEFLAGYGMERRGGIYRAFGTCEKRVAVFCHGGFGAACAAACLPPARYHHHRRDGFRLHSRSRRLCHPAYGRFFRGCASL